MKQARRSLLAALLGFGLLGAGLPSMAQAQAFPSKPIKLIVPFGPGSGTDTSARYFGRKLQELTGQPVVVENKAGANGFIAVKQVLSAPADGYTVFIGSNSTLAVNTALFRHLPYDPLTDFAPLTMMMRSPAMLAVAPQAAYSDLKGLISHADGQPGGGPMKVGVALTDILTGLYASTAILAALQAREHTGRGQHIDLALLDVGVACLANQSMNYLYGDQVPQRMGNAHPNTVPYQAFPTEDGHMILAVGNDGQFARFCHAAGRSEWAEDERFRSNAARLAHRAELVEMIRRVTLTRSTRAWVQLLEQHAVPCGPINTVREVFEDPQVRARGMQIAMTHPKAGQVPLVASPIRLSDTPVTYRHAPPQLGQHTLELLASHLGLSAQQMQAYQDSGVLG